MNSKTGDDASAHPLPNHFQEQVWAFVRKQISHHEATTGSKTGRFEIHVAESGKIEVQVLSTQTEEAAARGDGLED